MALRMTSAALLEASLWQCRSTRAIGNILARLQEFAKGQGGLVDGVDLEIAEPGVGDAEAARVDGARVDLAVAQLADARRAERGNFVQAVDGVDDPRADAAEAAQDRREAVGQLRGEDAEQL